MWPTSYGMRAEPAYLNSLWRLAYYDWHAYLSVFRKACDNLQVRQRTTCDCVNNPAYLGARATRLQRAL